MLREVSKFAVALNGGHVMLKDKGEFKKRLGVVSKK